VLVVIQTFAFYLFATLVIASGAITILARNPVHSVLWLILSFFNAAGLMVIAGAEFIAMLLVIVYVGAVAVLFLFVVMMLDIDFAELRAGFIKNFPLGIAIALVLLAELVLGIGAWRAGALELGVAVGDAAPMVGVSNIAGIGALLYGRYLFLFESAGLILLVAMVGAIVLTHRDRKDTRPQDIGKQIRRRPEDATVNTRPEVGKGVQL
jgi:NADH-quinone oxidoreductase subunit J